jgi:hypothetical protein
MAVAGSDLGYLILNGAPHSRINQAVPYSQHFGEVVLAIHGFAAGELVVCRYRMPSVLQPWIHSIYVGTVEEPGDDPALWNGSNSERHYPQYFIRSRTKSSKGTQRRHYLRRCRRFPHQGNHQGCGLSPSSSQVNGLLGAEREISRLL